MWTPLEKRDRKLGPKATEPDRELRLKVDVVHHPLRLSEMVSFCLLKVSSPSFPLHAQNSWTSFQPGVWMRRKLRHGENGNEAVEFYERDWFEHNGGKICFKLCPSDVVSWIAEPGMKVVFLCKGTRGDVAPALALAVGLRQYASNIFDTFVLATHAIHREKFQTTLKKHGIHFAAVDKVDPGDQVRSLEKTELQVSSGRGFSDVQRQDRVAEMHSSLQACEGADAIVFNLFACEGWFIAKLLRVPCVAVSPFAVTRTPPVTFESKFIDAYPDLYQRLQNAPPGQVSYGDIDHWMWRLYLDDFGEFCDTVELPVCPFADLPPSQPLPTPTTLLYGISPTVIEKPSYWPDSVKVCGYWFGQTHNESLDSVTVHYPMSSKSTALPQFLDELAQENQHPLYIGFGSMEELGFFSSIDCVELLGVLNEGLLECNKKAILQVGPSSALLKAWEMLRGNVVKCHIYCAKEYICHAKLFPRCLAVVHHGGAGTVGECLRAGAPQIVCPFMFDQSYWGDKVAWMGVGESVGHPRALTAEVFTAAVRNVCTSDVCGMAAKYQNAISQENGVTVAVRHLERALRAR